MDATHGGAEEEQQLDAAATGLRKVVYYGADAVDEGDCQMARQIWNS